MPRFAATAKCQVSSGATKRSFGVKHGHYRCRDKTDSREKVRKQRGRDLIHEDPLDAVRSTSLVGRGGHSGLWRNSWLLQGWSLVPVQVPGADRKETTSASKVPSH